MSKPLTMTVEDYEHARTLVKYAAAGGTVDAPFFCTLFAEAEALRSALAAAEDKNATLIRDLELACRDLAAVKLSRDAAEAELAEYEGTEGRCPEGHNKRFTYDLSELGGNVGCVACERDELARRLADEVRHADELAKALERLRFDETPESCWCPIPCDDPPACRRARKLLAAHAARRAGKEEAK